MNKILGLGLVMMMGLASANAAFLQQQLTTNTLVLGTNGQVLVVLPGGGIGWTVKVDQASLDATNAALLALIATKASQSALDATNTALLSYFAGGSNSLFSLFMANDATLSNNLRTAFLLGDSNLSNNLFATFMANDASLSNNLYSAYMANDASLSNNLFTTFMANDAAVSNNLYTTLFFEITNRTMSTTGLLSALKFVSYGTYYLSITNLTNTVIDGGVVLTNATPAVAGGQSYTPPLRLAGNGWKTTATAASQSVYWDLYGVPVQGASTPSGIFKIVSVVNGATSNTNLQLTSGGNLSVSGNITGATIVATSGVTVSGGGGLTVSTANIAATAGSVTAGAGVIIGGSTRFSWGGDAISDSAGVMKLEKTGGNTNAGLLFALAPSHLLLTNNTELLNQSGYVYDNLNAAGPQTNTLPTPSMETLTHNWFVCLTNNIMAITAPGGVSIAFGNYVTPANGTIYTTATNSAIHLISLTATLWVVDHLTGFWTNAAGTYLDPVFVNNQLLPSSAGSAVAPPYSFGGETNTGMYKSAANRIGFTLGGTAGAEMNSVSGGMNLTLASSGAGGAFAMGATPSTPDVITSRVGPGAWALQNGINPQTNRTSGALWGAGPLGTNSYFVEEGFDQGNGWFFLRSNTNASGTTPGTNYPLVLSVTTNELKGIRINPDGTTVHGQISTNVAGFVLGRNGGLITNALTGSATLDFGNTANWTNTTLSITITGTLPGDVADVGIPGAAMTPNGHYSWWTTNDLVMIRYHNTGTNGAIARDPASGTFRAIVWKF